MTDTPVTPSLLTPAMVVAGMVKTDAAAAAVVTAVKTDATAEATTLRADVTADVSKMPILRAVEIAMAVMTLVGVMIAIALLAH